MPDPTSLAAPESGVLSQVSCLPPPTNGLSQVDIGEIQEGEAIRPTSEEEAEHAERLEHPGQVDGFAPALEEAVRSGFFAGVPEKVYHAHPAVSRSMLVEFSECGARLGHLLEERTPWELEEDEEESDALALGRALHTIVLEPEKAEERYKIAPETCMKKKRSGDPCTYSPTGYYPSVTETPFLCGIHSKKLTPDESVTILPKDKADRLKGMIRSIAEHDRARSLLVESPGVPELTAVAEIHGLAVRSRMDRLTLDVGQDDPEPVIVDLKTTRSAHPDDVRRDIGSKGYWLQAGLYPIIFEALTGFRPRMVFIFVEKTPPFPVVIYELDALHTQMVTRRAHELIDEAAEAISFCDFVAYTREDTYTVGLKRWDMKRHGMHP